MALISSFFSPSLLSKLLSEFNTVKEALLTVIYNNVYQVGLY